MIVHSSPGDNFQMHSFCSCIVAYLMNRKYFSIEFSHLIGQHIPVFMAIVKFIAYFYFLTYLPCFFVLKNFCHLLMILADYYQHPLLVLIIVEVNANFFFAFDSLFILGFVCLDYLFLEDGLISTCIFFYFFLVIFISFYNVYGVLADSSS